MNSPLVGRTVPIKSLEDLCVHSRCPARIEQMSSGRLDGTISAVAGRLMRIMRVEANQCVHAQGRPNSLFSVYLQYDEKCESTWQGREFAHRQISTCGAENEVNYFTGRRLRSLGVYLKPDDLQHHARVLLNTDTVNFTQTWAVYTPPPKLFDDFNHQVSRILDLGLTSSPQVGAHESLLLEENCIRSLVNSLFLLSSLPAVHPVSARSRLISRVEEFMRSRFADPVSAFELCREFGVSDRTLRLAFRERYGIGPMVYYKYLRLNAARCRIVSDRHISIAAAAREFGFDHLGNFAADYRRLFGMRPSETER